MPQVFDVSENPSQREFLESLARILSFIGGIGSGKTAVGAVKAIQKISEGKPGIIAAPDFPQFARATWPEFAKWCPWSYCTNRHLDHPYTIKKKLTFDIRGVEVPVYYGGIDNPQSWAGVNANWVWLDEGGRIKGRSAFDTLLGRMRVPPDPQFWTTTTPVGQNHWLYDVFVKGIFPEGMEQELRDSGFSGDLVHYVKASTEMNRHNLDPMYYLTLKGMYSGKLAQQELEGEFISLEGLVWDQFGSLNITKDADYISGVPVEWWVDDGFTKGHPRVILMAQIIPPYVNVFDNYIAEYELAEVSIKNAMARPYPLPSVAYVDSSAAELRNRLWNSDIDTVKATHSVEEGIKRAASWICDGDGNRWLRFHPRCEYSIKELQGYVRDERTGKPVKDSDNVADAVRYGLVYKDRDEIIQGGTEEYRGRAVVDERVEMEDITPLQAMGKEIRTNQELMNYYLARWSHVGGGRK